MGDTRATWRSFAILWLRDAGSALDPSTPLPVAMISNYRRYRFRSTPPTEHHDQILIRMHADEYTKQHQTSAYSRHMSERVETINLYCASSTRKCQDAGFQDPTDTKQPHKVTSTVHTLSRSHSHPHTATRTSRHSALH
jgi:hypothetical protein